MLHSASPSPRGLSRSVAVGICLIAISIGALGGLAGWEGQALLLIVGVPAVLILLDYRIGIALAVLVLPYANSKLVPSTGPLTVQNVVLLGVGASFLLHWTLARARGRLLVVPVTRELVWYYLVPLTFATCVGSMHLSEISAHYLAFNKTGSFGLSQYWISNYTKQVLLVALACVVGASVVERGRGRGVATTVIVSGVLLTAAIVAVIVSTGATLSQLQNVRDLLGVIGRHNTEAAAILLGAVAPALFMREQVKHRLARFMLLVSVGVMVTGLALTMSRGAFAGLLVVLAIYVWRLRRPGLWVGVLALSVAGFAFMPDAVRERLLLGLEGGGSVSAQVAGSVSNDQLTQGRAWIWRQVAPEVLNSPLIGRGMMSTQWSYAARSGIYYSNHPHNLFLELLMDAGILGAIPVVLFWRYLWRLFRKLGCDERVPAVMRGYFIGAATSLLGMVPYALSNGHWFPSIDQFYIWIGIGLAVGYQRWLALQPATLPVEREISPLRRFSVPDSAILGPR